MEWLVVGSAPTVLDWLDQINSPHSMRVITCNSGIKLVRIPDYYLICDQKACQAYQEQARYAHRNGTRLVTLRRVQSALRDRGVDWFDEFLELGRTEPTRDAWGCYRYTGPLCVEYACRNGARAVHLVGMTGYTKDMDYFDDDHPVCHKVVDMWQTHTVDNIRPRMQTLAEVFSEVRFYCYGVPCYDVISPNWSVIDAGDNPSSRRFRWTPTEEYVPD